MIIPHSWTDWQWLMPHLHIVVNTVVVDMREIFIEFVWCIEIDAGEIRTGTGRVNLGSWV